jgi:predicted DNA-binding transcriptional regulator YafY
LVSILLLLQTRGRLTAAQLAEPLEVSIRTIYRDIEALGEAGVPVYGEAGHDGGFQLVDGYRTRLTGLTSAEAEALFLAGLPSAAADLGLAAVVDAAWLKVLAALPTASRESAEHLAARFHLDAPSWYTTGDDAAQLTVTAEAVWNQQAIRMRYLRWASPQEVERTVEPYGLVLKAGQWYLVACTDRGLRTYRISRMSDVVLLEHRFERPAGFDLARHWQDYLASYDRRRHRGEAVLRLSPNGMARLPWLLEPAVAAAARRTAGDPDPDGWVQVTVPIESVEQALPDLLRLGAEAEVLAPVGLRTKITETLAVLTAVYGSASSPKNSE